MSQDIQDARGPLDLGVRKHIKTMNLIKLFGPRNIWQYLEKTRMFGSGGGKDREGGEDTWRTVTLLP